MIRHAQFWKPVPIEVYFSDYPDYLKMWSVLGIKEEKRVPWYADEPIATSKKVDLHGISRSNFDPENNYVHLSIVAKAAGIKTLSLDMKEAFQQVLIALNPPQGDK